MKRSDFLAAVSEVSRRRSIPLLEAAAVVAEHQAGVQWDPEEPEVTTLPKRVRMHHVKGLVVVVEDGPPATEIVRDLTIKEYREAAACYNAIRRTLAWHPFPILEKVLQEERGRLQ